MPTTFARPELLATPDWLAQNLSRPGVRVLDCRWRVDGSARQEFSQAHIPSAVHLDWPYQLVDNDDPLPFQLAGPVAFAAAMVRAGVGDGNTVVVYDDTQSMYAARVWWSLRAYGFESVKVLNGGWPAWVRSGRPTASGLPQADVGVVFTPRLDPRRRLSTTDVASLLGSDQALLLDVRTPAEYLGQGGLGPRRGHIAGAINLPAANFGDATGQGFPPAERLMELLARSGVDRSRRIVVYDATGIGAAKVAFTLELLGYEDVALYDGGWADWAPRSGDDYPVEG